MCGVCGIISFEEELASDCRKRIRRMMYHLRHRGPDDRGVYLDDHAVLGHTRLSVVDPEGGAQPQGSDDGALWVVFNGEIYNHIELRAVLQERGHRLRTRSDTEVLLRLYESFGADGLHRLDGQFAFAAWNRRERSLFLARDRFGIRPLYYAQRGTELLFASEVKSLAAGLGTSLSFDPIGLGQVFTFWGPQAPRTVFEGIRQLPPGHALHASSAGIRVGPYWELRPPARADELQDLDECVERLHEALLRSVRMRMRADVPVAAYLSGGLDSSLTTAVIRRYTETPLDTFSIRFDEKRFDEGDHQDRMVRHLGTRHRSVQVDGDAIIRALPEVIRHVETPLLRLAPVPLHLLSKLVRESGFKVVVTGEGADEVFAGYEIFKEDKVRRFWARRPDSPFRPLLLSHLYPYVPHDGREARIWQRFFAGDLGATHTPCYSHAIRWNNTRTLWRLFGPELRLALEGWEPISAFEAELPDDFADWPPLSRAQYIEVKTFLSSYLLSSQGDRVAMSHSVEGRFPFLDHELAELALAIPARFRLRGLIDKYILRRAARELLPPAIRWRPKQPYRAPDGVALRRPSGRALLGEMLTPERLRDAGCFDAGRVERLLALVTRTERTPSARDEMGLVAVLTTQLLHEQFIANAPWNAPPDDFACRTVNGEENPGGSTWTHP